MNRRQLMKKHREEWHEDGSLCYAGSCECIPALTDERDALRAWKNRLIQAVKDRDATIARLKISLRMAKDAIDREPSVAKIAAEKALAATPEENRRAIEAEAWDAAIDWACNCGISHFAAKFLREAYIKRAAEIERERER